MSDDYSLYEHMCGDKVPHENQADAIRHAEDIRRKNGDNIYLSTYPCPFCSKWHVGGQHRKKRRRRRKAA
jgi:hypothetical protein